MKREIKLIKMETNILREKYILSVFITSNWNN